MRPYFLLLPVCLMAGCHHQAPATAAQPAHVVTRDVITAVPLDSSGTPRSTPPIPDSVFRNAMARAQAASALADTLVPIMDSLVLRVGQALEVRANRLVQARRADGSPIADFAPMLIMENQTVARFTSAGLLGVAVGRTHLIVRPLGARYDVNPSDHATRIPVVVLP